MNLKNKFRILRKQEGFTLVELIVVIAIIAILGGVAVPAYSGYIQKADITADKQLLADVNKAFVSACMVEGVDNFNRGDVSVTLSDEDGNKVIESLTVGAVPTFDTTFKNFYEGGEFKVATKLEYNAATGMFTAPDLDEESTRSVLNPDWDWSGLAALKTLFQDSNYFDKNAEDGGISALTGTIDNLTSVLAMAGNVTEQLAEMPAFQETMKALGIEGSTDRQELANAAVFFVADKLKNLDTRSLQNVLELDANGIGQGNLDDYLAENCGLQVGSNEAQFVKTALQYGVLQSYINDLPENTKDTVKVDGKDVSVKDYFNNYTPTNSSEALTFITNLTSTPSYLDYITNPETDEQEIQADKDINAFLQILGTVSDNKDAFGSVSGEGLFSNDDVQGVLKDNLFPKE